MRASSGIALAARPGADDRGEQVGRHCAGAARADRAAAVAQARLRAVRAADLHLRATRHRGRGADAAMCAATTRRCARCRRPSSRAPSSTRSRRISRRWCGAGASSCATRTRADATRRASSCTAIRPRGARCLPRYLANVFREPFDLYATPVFIEYRTDKNPYAARAPREAPPGASHGVARKPQAPLTARLMHRLPRVGEHRRRRACSPKCLIMQPGTPDHPQRRAFRVPSRGRACGSGARRTWSMLFGVARKTDDQRVVLLGRRKR